MSNIPTPHISAKKSDIAKTVLMPGDPLRSEMIAKTFLNNPILVNNVRGVQGYTGTYKGTRVTVMASGMGAPSMGIYSHELFAFYGVENIIRVGSAGTSADGVNVGDIILGGEVETDSNFDSMITKNNSKNVVIPASKKLLDLAIDTCNDLNMKYNVGKIFATDTFYGDGNAFVNAKKLGYIAVEMEGGALYHNAEKFKKNALVICTVSDRPLDNIALSSTERQENFKDMITLALNIACKLDKK